MPKATEIFPGPYTTDGCYIYDANEQMCLMAGDCRNYPEEMMKRVCEILNGTNPTKGNPSIGYDGPHIYLNGDCILVVRGWGYLTGTGCLNLSPDEATKVQDEFALHVINCLRGEGQPHNT